MAGRFTAAVAVALGLSAALAPASALAAGSGGVSVPSVPATPSAGDVAGGTSAGGGVAGRSETGGKRKRSSLDVASFSLNGGRFYQHGRALRASFDLAGRGSARVKLVFVRGGRRVKVVDLGARSAGRHSATVAIEGLPSGALQVRMSARDARNRLVRGAASRAIDVRSHRFPVVGPHSFGSDGSRFGSERDGGRRKHQGQDVGAAEGTPMVAARGGVVRHTGNQPTGAGIYLVISGAGESRDYVYMHLQEGSLLVRQGQTVRTGQLIGKVGNTGASQGAHLHFEIWQGAWQGGGAPIDPLPLLTAWDAWS